MSSDNFLMAC